jgi:hypothetical protein
MPISTIGQNGLQQSRILTAVQQPAGAVLQVVQYGEFTSGTLSSSTFVQLGSMSLSITPTATTSKVLAFISLPAMYFQFSTNPAHCYSTLYRNGTNLDTTGNSFGLSLISGNTTSGNNWASTMFSYLDSPATTFSTTYAVYVKNISGTNGGVVLGEGSSRASITLMEIAA